MKIRVKEAISKTAPGLWGRPIEFEAGEEVAISMVNYPGQYSHWALNNQYEEWDFWQNSDIDLSIIFKEGEIEALILSPQEREKLKDAPLDEAPFKVEIQ